MAREAESASQNASGDKRKRPSPKAIVFMAAAAVLLTAAVIFRGPLKEALLQFQVWVDGAGAIGYAAFVGVYIVATVAFVPCFLLTIASGLLFGVVKGSLVVSVGSTIGATCAYFLSRTAMRETIEGMLDKYPAFQAIDGAIGKSGGKIVFLIRLSPLFPYNMLNYALGLTRVKPGAFVLASWAGMFPGTVAYVYLGSLGNFFAADREKSPLEIGLFIVGLIATFAVSIVIARVAKKALDQQVTQ